MQREQFNQAYRTLDEINALEREIERVQERAARASRQESTRHPGDVSLSEETRAAIATLTLADLRQQLDDARRRFEAL